MLETLTILGTSDLFMPHGHCYLWKPGLVWLHVLSDTLIGLSYVAISATLVYLVYRGRRHIPFHWMFLAFGVFIVACGMTHFMEVLTVWVPVYWISGLVKLVTALASVVTAVLFPPLVPLVLDLIRNAQVSQERKVQLETTHGELESLYGKLKELDELKTQVFANISHELRTPLALLLGPLENLLAANGLAPQHRQTLEVMGRNARTLLRHVNDLLDLAKLDAGKLEARYAEADLARLVRLTAALFETSAAERQIAFSIEAAEAVPAQVDPEKLQRVFLNLLSNAFKFTPPGGRIRCVVQAEDGRARISVQDSGPGVAPELREAIFERFHQGEGGDTRRFGGTGLGLAIARQFIELHGGSIAVAEAPEGGAAFHVELPLLAPPNSAVHPWSGEPAGDAAVVARQAAEELALPPAAPALPEAANGHALVLVVEDNPDMNRFIVETLGPEFATATASDGQDGLEKALASPPDLILSDLMMPRLSGEELLRAVRARPELEPVPVVLLTAKADYELRLRLLRSGAQDYLMKPFSAEELRARVRNLIAIKRTREVLQRALDSQLQNVEALAREVATRRRELQTALESMRVARDSAEQAGQIKNRFIRLVSHELRTPLTALQLQLYILQRDREDKLSPRQLETVRKISTAATRLLALVESLIEYAKIQSGRLLTHVESFDLPTLAAEVVEELQPQAKLKNLELRLLPSTDLPPLVSDRQLVRLIMVNLVGNAVKYTEHGGAELALAHDGAAHRIAVRDTGPGIPPEQQALIFEPFEHLEPIQHKHTPGFGLGLTLVKEMMVAVGGRIELVSQVGEGSTFTAVIPPAAADQHEELAGGVPASVGAQP